MLPDFCLPRLEYRVNMFWLRHLGALECANYLLLAPARLDLLEVVIRHVKINAALLDEHGDPVAWYFPHQQGKTCT